MFENITYDLSRIPYGRRGTFYYLSLYENEGKQQVYACALYSGMNTAATGQTARFGKMFPIKLERDGKELEYTAEATPVCVNLKFDGGSARICFQEDSILRMEAIGADVVLSPDLNPHEIAKDRNDGSWEVLMNPVPKLLFLPVEGSMEVKTGFDVVTSMPEDTKFIFKADAEGKLDLAVHMYLSNAWKLNKYPDFEDCINGIEKEFKEYLDTVPALPAEFEEGRVINAFIVWSSIVPIDGTEFIYMNKGVHRFTTSWQQVYHAMGQYNNPKFAWELLLSVFRYQDDYGMLPDGLFDSYQSFGGCKPPFHGVALEFLKDYTDFSFAPRKEQLTLYKGLSDLVYWWLSYRDTDNDGIAQYDTADESGWDDCSFFRFNGPAETPDLATYLILAMDNLSEMAGRLGKTYEKKEWKAKADAMLKNMIDFFWDGEMFKARANDSHEWITCGSIVAFFPMLLGKRLPQDIIDKLTEKLAQEGKWLSPYGLAGESMDSDFYHESGWLAGPILAPAQLLIVLGLHACGKDELAKDIAMRYCRAMVKADYPMVISALTGKDVSEGRWGTKYPNRMAWSAMVFILLGSLFGDK